MHLSGGEFAYSYVLGGRLGCLEYALASPGLLHRVLGTSPWHINADEPDIIDYFSRSKQPAEDIIYEPDAYRSSDHDPVIVALDVLADGYPQSREIDCDSKDPLGGYEPTAIPGNNMLMYDAEKDEYLIHWLTQSDWKRTCVPAKIGSQPAFRPYPGPVSRNAEST